MQDFQEGGDGVAGRFTNLGFVDEGLIEQSGGILLFFFSVTASLLSLRLLASGSSGDIKSHLTQLVFACAGLLATPSRTAQMAVGAGVVGIRGGKLDSDFVAAG